MNLYTVFFLLLVFTTGKTQEVPQHFRHVDQVIWVVDDLDKVINNWKDLGFEQIAPLGTVNATSKNNTRYKIRLAVANLGGAHITWIEPVSGKSVFSEFLDSYGEGAMSLVHKLAGKKQLDAELKRLSNAGVNILDEISISTKRGKMKYTLMDTRDEGKYVLGYITDDTSDDIHEGLNSQNRHNMKINQYAFAIREADNVSKYWAKIGFPEFQISHPELSDTKYHGKLVDHKLIQGWQRQGDIAYEWCIPVKGPIVYADHINLHGEGIHHLAFTVDDMDKVLNDYKSRGYENTMGGRWGEKGKPGSGRYEYVDLEQAGGITMELLWSMK